MNNKKLIIVILSILLISCKPVENSNKDYEFTEIGCVEGYKFTITRYGRVFTQIFDDVGHGIKCNN